VCSSDLQETPVSTPAPEETADIETETETTQTATIAEPTAPTPAPAAQPAVSEPVEGVADTRTRLNQARQTYWNGDLAGAEALYAALARDEPGNPDVNGELGNVLYAQRRYGEAAEAYLATGRLLVETGHPAQVMPLINVLQAIAPEKAATLYALLTN